MLYLQKLWLLFNKSYFHLYKQCSERNDLFIKLFQKFFSFKGSERPKQDFRAETEFEQLF